VKIEGMLRQIPGMAEAMVIGDNRPALSALLWLKVGSATAADLMQIDRYVLRVNNGLSHPEQVKRWAILAESPAINNGELTGNMKLRRQVVLARRAEVVEMLYDRRKPGEGSTEPEVLGVLHVGEIQYA
jgi:long-chain acyl-CoA synthetase